MRPSTDMAAADLEGLVCAAAARSLRLPPDIVGLDVPFARLGLDSLGCLELADDLESALGIRVPAEALVESTTVRSLCATLTVGAPADLFDRMRADAELPADIRPRPARGTVSLAGARHVLLTGATGFLGSALLDVLSRQTQTHVTCLVRPGSGARSAFASSKSASPGARSAFASSKGARSQFARSGTVDDANADLAPDVEIVEGDLTLPSAGLSDHAWRRLVARTDAVVHAGASINWVAGYEALYDVNVAGTRELLRLAAEAGASFHFISSVSVCYSSVGVRTIDERHDSFEGIEGLHFGYAQSKAVAEALVRQAGARGLRTRIYRPALITGDSRTGGFNRDDMLSRLIAGCVRMGAAPDLDWQLDALPVDSVAAAILALAGEPAAGAWHLTHPRPRHWRECVLWMRLYGYDVTLMPYREWTARLRHAASDPDHPLRPLRSFFLDEFGKGLTIPELHEQSRAPKLDARLTSAAIGRTGVTIAPLDAALMDRYFTAFVEAGTLPEPRRRTARRGGLDLRGIDLQPFDAGHSIISELTAWQSGGACGLFGTHGADGRPLVLKVTAHSDDVQAVGQALAALCGERLGAAYRDHGACLGSAGGHEREAALYRDLDPVLRAHTPAVSTRHADPCGAPAARASSVLLEDMRGAELLDAVDRPEAWTDDYVRTAVDGIAAIHGAWHRRVAGLRREPWIGTVRNTATVEAMTPLWRALADHAAPMFHEWAGPVVSGRHRRLIDRIGTWRPALDAAPQTLIHNDFNPRNLCFRAVEGGRRLCVFDWELATIGAPMRDLAELLCFVSPPGVQREWIDALIDRHAARFSAHSGEPVDSAAWRASFAAALAELLIDRLPVYAMVHRVKPQRFLPRLVCTWTALNALFPVHGLAG